jgi:5-methylcytosine-specific restriction endonuclease McrA
MMKEPKIYIPCSWANDLSNQRFGRLTALIPVGRKYSQIIWLCECSCKDHFLIETWAGALRTGNTVSCGCWKIERGMKPFGKAAFHRLWYQYTSGAKKRGMTFKISQKLFRKLTSSKCHYCRIPPSTTMQVGGKTFNGDYLYNGLDRINSKKGYVPNNVVPCCGMCNRAKYTMGYDKFVAWIRRLQSQSVSKLDEVKFDA